MNRILKILVISMTAMLVGCSSPRQTIFKEDNREYTPLPEDDEAGEWKKYQPVLKNGREKFTIGLIQSDDYPEYYEVFIAIIEGLKLLGWIGDSEATQRSNYQSNREFINHTGQQPYSDYLEFSPEMFFSFMASAKNAGQPEFRRVMDLAEKGKIDLVILLGTLASKEVFKNRDYNTATIMDAVSDPLGSGLVASAEDSGRDFLSARIDSLQYIRQGRLFYDVIGFSRLGLIYENSENGRNYGAVEHIEKVAAEKGFSLIRSYNAIAEPTLEQYGQAWKMYLEALDTICPQVDALFMGFSGGLEKANMPRVVQKLIDYRIPSFSIEGSPAVKQGIMLGVGGREAGLYNAKKIISILKGAEPRDLDQKFEKTPRISINLKTAELMKYNLPVDIIRSADEIYTTMPGITDEQ